MDAKEKAKELVDKFHIIETSHWNENMDGRMTMEQIGFYSAKQCALIAVDEIIDAIDFDWMERQNLERQHAYWQEVRQEIEKL